MSKPNIYSVESLTAEIKKLLEMSYADVWVEGEVSSLASPASGHTYFTLKDSNSVLKCVLFKNKKYLAACLPVEGERILIRGRVSIYTGRGDVQLICSYIEAAGEGALRRQFEALKNKLKSDGLFDEDAKQALPERPTTIALITSPEGAVLHDIISILNRRYPFTHLKVYPSNVQGEKAKETILAALETAISDTPDVIILARGGGSLEDLQVFNEEAIARALFACPIPTISAIGHETDFVISDFVADARAPTPTAAATMITPDISDIRAVLQQNQARIALLIANRINALQQNFDVVNQRLRHPRDTIRLQTSDLQQWQLKLNAAHLSVMRFNQRQLEHAATDLALLSPQSQLKEQRYHYQTAKSALDRNIAQTLNNTRTTLVQFVAKLNSLSPLSTLSRGYAILQKQDGEIIQNISQIDEHEKIKATLHQGKLGLTVDSKDH